ncbi:MAG: hypothetical protein ABI175_18095 [Polyangiales bacterium]
MSKQQNDVLGEIERLEGELQRIGRELEGLRRRVDGPNRTGRTQAFAGVPAVSLPPPAQAGSPSSRASANSPPSSRPRPSPTIPPKTGTRPISERATSETAPMQAAVGANDRTGSGRRAAGPMVGLEHEPSSPPPRGRESPAPREAGRYEFVQEAKPRSSTRR